MQVAIMQPYFLPYVGYYQLIAAADVFVVYDNIKYTKKGWINRNRFLLNDQEALFSLSLKKASDACTVVERELSPDFDREGLLRQLLSAYVHAPYYESTRPMLREIIGHPENNLFRYIHHSLVKTCAHIGIDTEIRISSEIDIDHDLKGQSKVLALCQASGASMYLNAIGGTELYERKIFKDRGIELKFIKSKPFDYPQFSAPFVPWLSIIDVLMFNPLDVVRTCLAHNYDLI
jgi:hypothetical protein